MATTIPGRVMQRIPSSPEQLQLLAVGKQSLFFGESVPWILANLVGPIVSLFRSSHGRVTKLHHAAGYLMLLVCISRLWSATQRLEAVVPRLIRRYFKHPSRRADEASIPFWEDAS